MESPDQACAFCDKPIDVGEAWMVADADAARRVAHSGCVYENAANPEEAARWVPSEYGPAE